MKRRLGEHIRLLKRNCHFNDQFQADYDEGNTALRIQKIAGIEGTPEEVDALEMKFARKETRAYNIRTGTPGDMRGRCGTKLRAEDYIDIEYSRGIVSTREIMERFGIGANMVSMIQTGARKPGTFKRKPTSFVNVVSDFYTVVNVPARAAA